MRKTYSALGRVTPLLLVLSLAVGTPALAQVGGFARGGKPDGGGGGKPGKTSIDHRGKQSTPIKMGTSGGNINDEVNGICASGALGALLTDGTPGVFFVLSNSHVFAQDRSLVPSLEQIIQPGLADLNCNVYASLNLVGDVVSATSLEPTMLGSEPGWDRPVGNVDAAVASATATMVSPDGAILGIGLIDPSPVDAFPGQLVTKSGRTTGVTSSRVDATNVTMSVGYSDYPGGPQAFIREFYGQIVIKNRRNKFLAPGDSGSLAVEEGTLRPVALLFAGGNSIALANPAQDVLDYFDFDELTAQTSADSTGQCNSVSEYIRRGSIAECLAWPRVERACDLVELGLGVAGKVGPLRQVLAEQACTAPGFLDSGLTVFASTLPRPARRGRVAPGRGFDSRISPASTVRCMSA